MPAAFLIALALQVGSSPVDPASVFEEREVVFTGGEYQQEKFKYRLLKPAKIEPGKKYPLVVFLHGAGERGDDNRAQLKYFPALMATAAQREKYPCFVLAPQCRTDKRWVEVDWDAKDSKPQAKEPGSQMKVAMTALDDILREHPVDTKRLYLTGLSMGGYGTWDWAAREPKRFAAAAPICGGGDERTAELLKVLPIWCFHGDADTAVPVERSRRMIEAIQKAGGHPKYSELKGVGHDSWTPAYNDPKTLEWLFEQAKR